MSSFLGGGGGSGTAVSPLQINTYTVNHVLALNDAGAIVEMNLAGANTITVPTEATVPFPIGTWIKIVQIGVGATTIVGMRTLGSPPVGIVSVMGPAGAPMKAPYQFVIAVTVHNAGTIAAEWDSAFLYKRGNDEWVLTI